MKHRIFALTAVFAVFVLCSVQAGWRDKLNSFFQNNELSESRIIEGLKEALKVGTEKAVQRTGIKDGYWGNEKIKIPMPEKLEKVDNVLRKIGMGKEMDKFLESMNRAAEEAAPLALDIFKSAVKDMSISDARNILKGENHAATDYFATKTREGLSGLFMPIVDKKLDETGSARLLDNIVGRYNKLPLVKPTSFELDEYVTGKALDGLFHVLGEEEQKIRTDPKARVSEILKEVFANQS